jgi:hypothetical protein
VVAGKLEGKKESASEFAGTSIKIMFADGQFQDRKLIKELAEPTGLEPATSDVTGRRSNQLNYDSAFSQRDVEIRDFNSCDLVGTEGLEPPTFSV